MPGNSYSVSSRRECKHFLCSEQAVMFDDYCSDHRKNNRIAGGGLR